MEIIYLNESGVPDAEKNAFLQFNEVFNKSNFTKKWKGYASFSLPIGSSGGGTLDCDFVLITHNSIFLIELKNWNASNLTSDGKKWYVNGHPRENAYTILQTKKRVFYSTLKKFLGKLWKEGVKIPSKAELPIIRSFVVMDGHIKDINLPDNEFKDFFRFRDFLDRLAVRSEYDKIVTTVCSYDPLDYINDVFDKFFSADFIKPKNYNINGYIPEADPIFVHPEKLYEEYKAHESNDRSKLGLIRNWDFTKLNLIVESERPYIGLREQQIYEYIEETDLEKNVINNLMRPVVRSNEGDVNLYFTELYKLERNIERYKEFSNSFLHELTEPDKYTLIKSIANTFKNLHSFQIAHRDIGKDSIWVNNASKYIVISSFYSAYFPQNQTVSSFRSMLQINKDNPVNIDNLSPYQNDVYKLGNLFYNILFDCDPVLQNGVFFAEDNLNIEKNKGKFKEFFVNCLSLDKAKTYKDASDLLDAFNVITFKNFPITTLDYNNLQHYKPSKSSYQVLKSIRETDDFHFFISESGGKKVLVKEWYGADPEKSTENGAKIVNLLDKANKIRACEIPGLVRVMDVGLHKRSQLLLVQEWLEGETLVAWGMTQTLEAKLNAAFLLVETLQRIHFYELAHGDVHPKNIIISEDCPYFIDFIDYRPCASEVYNLAYLPITYNQLTLEQRDNYGIVKSIVELLINDNNKMIENLKTELAGLLSSTIIDSLEPLLKIIRLTIENLNKPELEGIVVSCPKFTNSETFLSDNGKYNVQIYLSPEDHDKETYIYHIRGATSYFTMIYNETTKKIQQISRVMPSSFVISKGRWAKVEINIILQHSVYNDSNGLIAKINEKEEIKALLSNLGLSQSNNLSSVTINQTDQLKESFGYSVKEIWRKLIDVEETTFLTVSIIDEPTEINGNKRKLIIPICDESRSFEFDKEHTIEVQNYSRDNWYYFGLLNIHDSELRNEYKELVVENITNYNVKFTKGDKLRLVSNLEKSSFSRRVYAVNNILENKARYYNLMKYLEPNSNCLPKINELPVDFNLSDYSNENKSLNQDQIDSFKKILTSGPISILQGPPGTGKTWFIACLMHYLVTKRKSRILLVSQSHEGVNNALEKAIELFFEKGEKFSAVRVGDEYSLSGKVLTLHANSIENEYKIIAQAEQKNRLLKISKTIGVPQDFSAAFINFYLDLGLLYHKIDLLKLNNDVQDAQKIHNLEEVFYRIAANKYFVETNLSIDLIMDEVELNLMTQYKVYNKAAVEKLKVLIKLSNEWIKNLGSSNNFEEFLAKTRSVVAGTLVGIGYKGSGIVDNEYDWVIIDEAARAMPSELAVPLQTAKRVLLVGDHMQLPPMYADELKSALKTKLNIQEDDSFYMSDFQRVFESEYGKRVSTSLKTQYRMAPVIGDLVSSCFYNNCLINAKNDSPDYFELLPQELSYQVTWIDSGNQFYEVESKETKGFYNEHETKIIVNVLIKIFNNKEFIQKLQENSNGEPPIGVICMYKAQKRRLKEIITNYSSLVENKHLIKIDTVDSYQGKENKIVILSTIRNNPRKDIGFLKSHNRINVAISRAMERLIIIGAVKMWQDKNEIYPLGAVLKKIIELSALDKAVLHSDLLFKETA
jgi:superfamily I DNA and/or RNA helicase